MHSARLVVGYGNPLRSDDGLGWTVARILRRDLERDASFGDVVVLAEHQLTPELAEPISRAGLVIFVDAREGGQPGRIATQALGTDDGAPLAFSHDVDPPSLVRMARLLYGACPTAAVISVVGDDFGYGTTLSPVVEAAVREVVQVIRDMLAHGSPVVSGSDGAASQRHLTGG
jgi:hydrogenase maturation protease